MNATSFHFVKNSDPGAHDPQHVALVRQTEKWVAQSFYGTLLKQMRDDPFRSKLMDGGRGGQAFGEMFDQRLAEHMSRSVAPGLGRSIVHKIEGPRAAANYKRHAKSESAAAQARLRRLSGEATRSSAEFERFHVTAH